MNKAELIESVQKALGSETTKRLAEEAVEAVLTSILKALKKDKIVELPRLGVLVKCPPTLFPYQSINSKKNVTEILLITNHLGFTNDANIFLGNYFSRNSFSTGFSDGRSPEKLSSKRDTNKSSDQPIKKTLKKLAKKPSKKISKGTKKKEKEGKIHTLWFGTNRKQAEPDSKKYFTTEFTTEVILGQVEVFVPKAHRFGETGTTKLQKFCRWAWGDDTLKLKNITPQTPDEYWTYLKKEMNSDKDGAQALIYIHGYNNSFEDTAIRAAQLDADLQVNGITAFYSWPSQESIGGYNKDIENVEASEQPMTDFLISFAKKSGAKKIHIIAHSMGNRILLRALQRITANASKKGNVKFGQIILAAPDIDSSNFLSVAEIYKNISERTTLYASDADKAVAISAKRAGLPRAGYFKPYTITAGIDTIAVPNFNIEFLGHGYFAKAEALLHDIHTLISYNPNPDDRQRLQPLLDEGKRFWKFTR